MKMTKKTKNAMHGVFLKNSLKTKSAMHGVFIKDSLKTENAMHGAFHKKKAKKAYFELKLTMPFVAQIKKSHAWRI